MQWNLSVITLIKKESRLNELTPAENSVQDVLKLVSADGVVLQPHGNDCSVKMF